MRTPSCRHLAHLSLFWLLLPFCSAAHAQVSLSTVVELAIRNSPRVKMAQSDVQKAAASLSQAKDVFIPSFFAGAGLGQSYGYSFNPPTLFSFSGQSLVYNGSQFDYIRSGRAGLLAAQKSLQDMRETVAEDAALTFAALDYDQQRGAVLEQQNGYAARLTQIVQDRMDAGRDSPLDLTVSRLTAAQLHLSLVRNRNQTEIDRDHLARLLGISPAALQVAGGFPPAPAAATPGAPDSYVSVGVASAYANALAKRDAARGDAGAVHRPQLSFVIQYNRYATFTNSFKTIQTATTNTIGANEGVFGFQLSVPVYDRQRRDKARESAAEADRSLHEAEYAQFRALDARAGLRHNIEELEARTQVAALEQQLAQQQLEILGVQLANASGSGTQMSPRDEQNSLISEREKYLAVLEANYQLRQAQINLLRQSDQLQDWVRSVPSAP